jgi:hypothetical protein
VHDAPHFDDRLGAVALLDDIRLAMTVGLRRNARQHGAHVRGAHVAEKETADFGQNQVFEVSPFVRRHDDALGFAFAQPTLGVVAHPIRFSGVERRLVQVDAGIDAATSLASLRFATALSVVPSEYSGRIARPPAELFGFVTRARQMPSAPGGTSVPVLARAMVGSLHGQVRRARAVSDEFTETEPASKSLERPWVEPSGPWERAGEGAPAWLALPRRGVGEKYAAAPDLLRR